MSLLRSIAHLWLTDFKLFTQVVTQRPLYGYQLAPALAILDSVLHQRGREFAVMFPRQSGKNETQAQLEAFLLNVFQHVKGAQIVKAAPTFSPQAEHSLRRLKGVLKNDWNEGLWTNSPHYLVQLGEAQCLFYSAEPQANVVGATASLLLACDEAQSVQAEVWERNFAPMTLSTNATSVLWGTAWTAHTLLARAVRRLRGLEAQDGVQRVFVVSADDVAAENPHYGEAIRKAVARLGRNSLLVKTQYFNEEIDAEGGLFPPERRRRMQGTHAPLSGPRAIEPDAQVDSPITRDPSSVVGGPSSSVLRPPSVVYPPYAFLLDVGGEDLGGEQLALPGFELASSGQRFDGRRDATALTIVEVDLSSLADPLVGAPTYRVVHRQQWVNVSHVRDLQPELARLIDHWQPAYVVSDATGVGHGLASFLNVKLGERSIGVTLNAENKSRLGWGFVAICEAGRWQEWTAEAGGEKPDGGREQSEVGSEKPESDEASPNISDSSHPASDLQALFWLQLAAVQYEIRPGPKRPLAWGVPDGTKHPSGRGYLHDDLVLSAALAVQLDAKPWHLPTGPGVILRGKDPLEELDQGF